MDDSDEPEAEEDVVAAGRVVGFDVDRWLGVMIFVCSALFLGVVLAAAGSRHQIDLAVAMGACLVAIGSFIQALQELRRYRKSWVSYAAPGGFWRTSLYQAAVNVTSESNPAYDARKKRLDELLQEGRRRFAAHSVEERMRLEQEANEAMLKFRSWFLIVVGTLILSVAAVHAAVSRESGQHGANGTADTGGLSRIEPPAGAAQGR